MIRLVSALILGLWGMHLGWGELPLILQQNLRNWECRLGGLAEALRSWKLGRRNPRARRRRKVAEKEKMTC